MNAYVMTREQIALYGNALRLEERCEATAQKYVGAVTAFFEFLPEDKTVSREAALAWKAEISGKFAGSTVNVMISAVNRFFAFMSWGDIRIKRLKIQRLIFRDRDRELTKAEYLRLLNAAKASGNLRLHYLYLSIRSQSRADGKFTVFGSLILCNPTFLLIYSYKLKFGHRGANHPVREVAPPGQLRERLRTYITSQNHGYAVDSDSITEGIVSFINANHGTCEGVDYPKLGAFTVQFHPEAHGGPEDTGFLFERFAAMMSGHAEANSVVSGLGDSMLC